MNWRRVFIETAILAFAALIVAAGVNALRPETRKLAWQADYGNAAPGTASGVSPRPTSSVSDLLALAPSKDPSLIFLGISGDVALRLHEAGALFIDARRSSAYEQGHIAKAISIPVWEHDADARVSALQAQGISRDAAIVIYCSGSACEDAAMLANKLAQAGFFNIFLYQGGFPDWQGKQLPIAKGNAR